MKKEIKKCEKCSGYYWMSDSTDPVVFTEKDGAKEVIDVINGLLSSPKGRNPFVIEAQIYDSDHHLSYSIKYIDGDYIFNMYNVPEADVKAAENKKSDTIVLKVYFANRMPGKKLRFLQYWRNQEDEKTQEDENVVFYAQKYELQPVEMVFIGFTTN